MRISVATGSRQFVCSVRLFRGLQGKQGGGTSHEGLVPPHLQGESTNGPAGQYLQALLAAEATRDLPEGVERLVCLGLVIVECYPNALKAGDSAPSHSSRFWTDGCEVLQRLAESTITLPGADESVSQIGHALLRL
jgi:hypothetical protein